MHSSSRTYVYVYSKCQVKLVSCHFGSNFMRMSMCILGHAIACTQMVLFFSAVSKGLGLHVAVMVTILNLWTRQIVLFHTSVLVSKIHARMYASSNFSRAKNALKTDVCVTTKEACLPYTDTCLRYLQRQLSKRRSTPYRKRCQLLHVCARCSVLGLE
jgi:hypothetical protein